jgi:hypothetical protein
LTLIQQGVVKDYADLARLGQVSRARITQIMNLLNLAPDIQEPILFSTQRPAEQSMWETSIRHSERGADLEPTARAVKEMVPCARISSQKRPSGNPQRLGGG